MTVRKWLPPSDPPTLPYPFVIDFLDQICEKSLFGKPSIRFQQLFTVQARLFETGTVIGRALATRLNDLARTFSGDGTHEDLARHIREQAEQRAKRYSQMEGHEPDSLFDYFLVTELQGKGVPADAPWLWKGKKLDLLTAFSMCTMAMVDGIGFGASYREGTERLWSNSWGSSDAAVWDNARRNGLLLEQPKTAITLQEREQLVLQSVGSFVASFYPEVAKRLKLKSVGFS